MEHVTNQKQVERQILELVKTYNVLYKRQIYAFFAVDGKEKFVGKALHTLLKEHLIYINEVTKTVSQHEDAYQLREKGTLKAFWVLLSLMEQKKSNDISWQKRKSIQFVLYLWGMRKFTIFFIYRKLRSNW